MLNSAVLAILPGFVIGLFYYAVSYFRLNPLLCLLGSGILDQKTCGGLLKYRTPWLFEGPEIGGIYQIPTGSPYDTINFDIIFREGRWF